MARAQTALMLAFSLLIFTSGASAISSNSSSILSFASFAVPPNQTFSIAAFPFQGGQGFAVISDGEAYGIFASGLPILEDAPLTAPDDIEAALSAYYASMNYSRNITYADIHAGLLSVMGNREKGEAKCRILTGTDRTACTSFDSCQKACYSVTSFCLPIALGSGRPFIDEIWKFENNSRQLTEAYLDESVAYSALAGNTTPAEAKAYLDAIAGINRAATAASKSALFDAYSYCFEPDYALPVITNMELTAQKRYADAEPYFTLSETALLVRERTNSALARQAAQQADEEASARAAQAASALQGASPPQQNGSTQTPAEQGASQVFFIIIAAALIIILAAAYFLQKRRRKRL